MIDTQCIKVAALRVKYPRTDIDLKKWMSEPNNLYIGRAGRVFIKQKDGTNKIFVYAKSKWANPFKVGTGIDKFTLEESISRYENYILTSPLMDQVDELEGKVLGCFCNQDGLCHSKVLVKLFHQNQGIISPIINIIPNNAPVQHNNICTGTFKNGNPCTYRAKIGEKCGYHS